MSKLFENKQLIHIASEVVILLGIVFYVSQANKKLLAQIEEINQKLSEQEDSLKKHEKILGHLISQNSHHNSNQNVSNENRKHETQPETANHKLRESRNEKSSDSNKTKKQKKPETVHITPSQLLSTMIPQHMTTVHISPPFQIPRNENNQRIKFLEEIDESKIKEEEDENEEDDSEEDEQLDSEITNELKDLIMSNELGDSE